MSVSGTLTVWFERADQSAKSIPCRTTGSATRVGGRFRSVEGVPPGSGNGRAAPASCGSTRAATMAARTSPAKRVGDIPPPPYTRKSLFDDSDRVAGGDRPAGGDVQLL